MHSEDSSFVEFASKIYEAPDFNHGFDILQNKVWDLGFDGVLYSYIPQLLLDTQFHLSPVYQVSEQYGSDYLSHYADARFDRIDPLVQAVLDGIKQPIDWVGKINREYMNKNTAAKEVFSTAKDYGIHNGVTLPLITCTSGIAGASVISRQKKGFEKLLDERLETLSLHIRFFHQNVQNNAPYQKPFVQPLLDSLNKTEIQLLIGMAKGKSQAQIATELGRTEGYLEQVTIKVRRKFSGVENYEAPTINRNQLLYYAGLVNILQYQV